VNYLPLFFKYFHPDSLFALVAGALLFICAFTFFRKKTFWLKVSLFTGGACMAYFVCSLDLFLHDWDEQYHALVAKNMMSDLFNPVLYRNELLAGDSGDWFLTHIWLHKQPLFLWQMALSQKIFGIS
jgi:4-amino-4-deoxy-L-arabinose transferase